MSTSRVGLLLDPSLAAKAYELGRLLTPAELAAEFNLPSVRTVRTLRAQGLPTVKLGAARLIDYDDMLAFVEARKTVAGGRVALPSRKALRTSVKPQTESDEAYERLFGERGKIHKYELKARS